MEEQKQTVKCEACGKECLNLGSHMRFCKGSADKKDEPKIEQPRQEFFKKEPAKEAESILRNLEGKPVPVSDYFFGGVLSPGFSNICGRPVDREDLIAVFNRVFKPEQNFLFYKVLDKEVYIIIIPIKYSTTIGEFNNSTDGDFQKHAISFLNEGSVNLDTLKMKLDRIPKFCKFDNK